MLPFICLPGGNVTYTSQFEVHISIFNYVMNIVFLRWNLFILWMFVFLDKMIHTASNMVNFGINSYQGIIRYFKTTPKIKKNIDLIGAALITFAIHVFLPKCIAVKVWLIMLLLRVRIVEIVLTLLMDHYHLELIIIIIML